LRWAAAGDSLSVGGSRVPRMDDADARDEERVALVALLGERAAADPRRRYTRWSAIAAEVARRGSALAVWHERHPLTLDGPGESDAALVRARARLAGWRAADFDVLTVLDRRYPLSLRHVQPMPPLLFVRGALHADEVGVSVVGSRDASARGQQMASAIALGLVERGIAVISGLATGIDTAAHEATLAAGGRTTGVLGTGITRVYPESNRGLHERVATTGVLVSQFSPEHPPDKHTLALRNATMAGLSQMSVIVEAGERSGSRVHARYALACRRPLVVTDAVVASSRWGRELSVRSGVYVAGSTTEVLGIIDQVVSDVDVGA
jgi:DNA processing protein